MRNPGHAVKKRSPGQARGSVAPSGERSQNEAVRVKQKVVKFRHFTRGALELIVFDGIIKHVNQPQKLWLQRDSANWITL
jgi:hypothetical protein